MLVKLAGKVTLNEETGQLSTTFANTPQVPFEDLENGTLRWPPRLAGHPSVVCQLHHDHKLHGMVGRPARTIRNRTIQHQRSRRRLGCPTSPLPFGPSFTAGVSNLQAGAFTPFSLMLTDADGDQPLQGLTVHLPAGVAALLSPVTPCPEPQAARNECGRESLIGRSTASSGFGPDPVQLPGSVYLTGPYEGAPFGLAVVTPAVAGPFNLGDVAVRSRISVDPHTAAVTITSDPFPTFVKGVPVDLKQINVSVDRARFEYNPTSCEPMKIEGSLTGAQGASANVSSSFQVAGCQSLPFAPKLTASVGGHASKLDGASWP